MSMAVGSEQSSPEPRAGSGDALQSYLRAIGRERLTDPQVVLEQMRDLRRLECLGAGASTGASLARRAARVLRQEVVHAHLRLVVSCAFRWRQPGLALPDLIQEGNIGLLRAVERFDPERGVRFSSYAVWWIRQAILRAVENQSRTVRLPSRVCEGLSKRRRAMHALRARLAREPEPAELSAELGISQDALERLERADVVTQPAHEASGEERAPLVERLDDPSQLPPDAGVQRRWAARCLERVLAQLALRDRHVLELRWGLQGDGPLTLRQVAERLGLSAERVRQIEGAVLSLLRRRAAGRRGRS
jgi:RNA polymerase primary sigma factor